MARRGTITLLLLGLALAVSGCGEDQQAPPAQAPAGERPARLPNVVIYLIDTLRADHLGLYGAERPTSPGLDALGAHSAVFTNAVAQAPWTLPSVISLFTSTYPTSHGVVSGLDKLGPQAETMIEWAKGLGYRTLGFVTNTLGGTGAGLDQGYDDFFERPSQADMTDAMRAKGWHTLRPLMEMVETLQPDQPFFLYVHTVEPHWPYEGGFGGGQDFHGLSPQDVDHLNELVMEHRTLLQRLSNGTAKPGDAQRAQAVGDELLPRLDDLRALYDGDVRRADEGLQRLVTALAEQGVWQDTIMVVLADHGEEFHDHGLWFHDQSVYDELVRVPLVVRVPGLTNSGLRLGSAVQLIDLLPTLAALLGAEPLPFWQGHSFAPLLRGGAPPVPAPPVAAERVNVDRLLGGERGDRETALYAGPLKLIVHHDTARVSLYDRAVDPGEQHDLAVERPAQAVEMQKAVGALLSSLPRLDLVAAERGMDDDKLEHLKELGYVQQDR